MLTRRWYAWPRLRPRFRGTLGAGAAPGLLWGLRHLPVIDHLGVHPHGVDWAPVAAAFIAAVAVLDPGMRPPPDCSQPEDGMAVGGDDITAVQEHPRDRPPVRDRERS